MGSVLRNFFWVPGVCSYPIRQNIAQGLYYIIVLHFERDCGTHNDSYGVFLPQEANAGGSLMSVCVSNRKKSHPFTAYLDVETTDLQLGRF